MSSSLRDTSASHYSAFSCETAPASPSPAASPAVCESNTEFSPRRPADLPHLHRIPMHLCSAVHLHYPTRADPYCGFARSARHPQFSPFPCPMLHPCSTFKANAPFHFSPEFESEVSMSLLNGYPAPHFSVLSSVLLPSVYGRHDLIQEGSDNNDNGADQRQIRRRSDLNNSV